MHFKRYVLAVLLAILISPLALVLTNTATASEKIGSFTDQSDDVFSGDSTLDVVYTKPANYMTLVGWYQALETKYSNYLYVFKVNELYGTGMIPDDLGNPTYDDYYVRLTNESLGLHKPEVLFIGGPHGDETAGTISMYWFCDWLLRHAFNKTYIGAETAYLLWLLDNREIYFEISHNPYGFDNNIREDGLTTDLNREADMDCVNQVFRSVNGKTLVQFLNHHQIRAGSDFHGGARLILYPWGSTHQPVTGISEISSRSYEYASPDFHYFDASQLRAGAYMGTAGGYGGKLTETEIGTVPIVGYVPQGTICPWAYGADIAKNPVETPYVKNPPYPGAGVMWVTPELSPTKNPPVYEFGSDDTPGYGNDVRRFILHQVDLVQPYVKWLDGTIANNTDFEPGHEITLRWQVNGSMVVDHTQIVWGNNSDIIKYPQYFTADHNAYAGKPEGGTGWEGAFDGKLMNPVTYQETITLPNEPGDYYFSARAMVDQRYNDTLAPSVYGSNHTYLRLLKERCLDGWTEENTNATDGVEKMTSHKWWYSPVICISINKSVIPYLEIDITAPDGGEKWYTGRTYRLNFSISNGTPDYKVGLYLSRDGGFTWNYTIINNLVKTKTGPDCYFWTIPYTIQNSTTCKIKAQVQDANTDVGVDQSRNNFEIIHTTAPPVVPDITVFNPGGGEKWYIGEQHQINWSIANATPPYRVNIYLSDTGGSAYPYIITTNLPQGSVGNSSYVWAISSSYPVSTTCRIRVEAYDANDSYNGSASGLFEIANKTTPPPPPPPEFKATVLSPNGGESYVGGGRCDVVWTTENGTTPLTIDISYSIAGVNGTYVPIETAVANSGKCNWTLPNISSANCFILLMATDFHGNTTYDKSDSAFSIWVTTTPKQKGNLTGKVTDLVTGYALAGVQVTLYNTGSSIGIVTIPTDANGVYFFVALDAAGYDLQFMLAGYKESWLPNVHITAGETVYGDKTLEKIVTPPSSPNNTTVQNLPLGVGYECLSFIILWVLLALIALLAISSHKKKTKEEEAKAGSMFRPTLKPTDKLQQYLITGPPPRGGGLQPPPTQTEDVSGGVPADIDQMPPPAIPPPK